jgi:adenosylhomocysteine nucleosidase
MKKILSCIVFAALLAAGGCAATRAGTADIVVLISADAEWKEVIRYFERPATNKSPYGEWFIHAYRERPVLFFHGGWGKIAAAGSAQYAIDTWRPGLIINLGTCGGFEGSVKKGDVVLAAKTVVYDIVEQMGDSTGAIRHYSVAMDTKIFPGRLLRHVRPHVLVSADRDILPADIPGLKRRYGAIAADWESGAIAFVAARSKTRLIILRGVSDLVGTAGGEAYGNIDSFAAGTRLVMEKLLRLLPELVRDLPQ